MSGLSSRLALKGPLSLLRAGVGRDSLWRMMSAVLLAGLLGVMLATFRDYGITTDEGVQHRYSRRLVRWYTSLGADATAANQNDLYFYGGLFELAVAGAEPVSPLGVFDTRHLVNALFGFAGFVAAWGIGSRLGGPLGGFLSALFLASTPAYYGHSFANPKDIPLASLFALAAWAILRASERLPRLGWREAALSGLLIGLAAGVRVAGIVLLGYTAVLWLAGLWFAGDAPTATKRPSGRDLARTGLCLVATAAVSWTVMLALWPWAQIAPLRNPVMALQRFSQFWNPTILYDGQLVTSAEVSRYYIPTLFALTLPEFYLLAYLLGGLALAALLQSPTRPRETTRRLFQVCWVAALALLPIAWVVVRHTPLYDGQRHLLFVVPFLAVLAGASAAVYLRRPGPRVAGVLAALGLSASVALTVRDMVQLHPYQYVYFNRLFAGGLAGAVDRYETDYWCMSYKEGIEWMVRHYSRPRLQQRIRVAGYSTHVPFWYYLSRTEEGRDLFRAVTIDEDPHLVFATTAIRDQERTPGRVVHVVERQGAPLLYIFEVRTPS